MKFTPSSSDGFGSSHTPSNFEDLSWFDKTHIRHRTIFRPYIKKPAEFEIDKNPKLDTMWYYYIFFRGVEIYQFHSSKDFTVTEIDTPATDDDLKNIIKLTHNILRKNFEERRKEFPMFDSIGDVPLNTIEEIVPQLQEVLLQTPE
ncbi:hypothetical protein [Terrimonas pollutisoli]|uniref:hypothetical protein n=1 Tax=Terrimonas pollutisoli TaxID=3034147 RepID=UPI0023EC19C9|nr:hypothetical protein [Terrimonas sp. H1YJ31]